MKEKILRAFIGYNLVLAGLQFFVTLLMLSKTSSEGFQLSWSFLWCSILVGSIWGFILWGLSHQNVRFILCLTLVSCVSAIWYVGHCLEFVLKLPNNSVLESFTGWLVIFVKLQFFVGPFSIIVLTVNSILSLRGLIHQSLKG